MVVILDKELKLELNKLKREREINNMVEADFSGEYLNADNAKVDDIIVIVGKPTVELKQGKTGAYTATNVPIEINKKPKTYTPSRESGQRMVDAWGKEMDDWVGKKAKIKHVDKSAFGTTKTYIEAYPIK